MSSGEIFHVAKAHASLHVDDPIVQSLSAMYAMLLPLIKNQQRANLKAYSQHTHTYHLAGEVQVHLVEGVVDGLLLAYQHGPVIQVAGHTRKHAYTLHAASLDGCIQFPQSCCHLVQCMASQEGMKLSGRLQACTF
eukprot:365942-Chlamydomonas_euryale.AAC.24